MRGGMVEGWRGDEMCSEMVVNGGRRGGLES